MSRLNLIDFVKKLYPYHHWKDGAEFALRRGQLTFSEYAYLLMLDIEQPNNY